MKPSDCEQSQTVILSRIVSISKPNHSPLFQVSYTFSKQSHSITDKSYNFHEQTLHPY